ncbi:MAG: hypothetical protein JJU29_10115 [Verrucomicrobia bacterium]|nr:hypothetical protein [Verrucomicrobiota bacterium]MCH8510591.1 hypothetical protein [Kiritimatiellia bacterium]
MNDTEIRISLKFLLHQAEELLDAVEDREYNRGEPLAMNATLGGHLRHVLEHVEPIMDTPENGVLDYDARPRDHEVETSPVAARQRVAQLCERLDAQPDGWEAHGLRVRNRVATGDGGSPVVRSSRARELMYAVAHTVHHYALIRVMCGLRGIELSRDFGYAPSTLQHRQMAGRD